MARKKIIVPILADPPDRDEEVTIAVTPVPDDSGSSNDGSDDSGGD